MTQPETSFALTDRQCFVACTLILLAGSVLAAMRLPAPDIAWPLYIAQELLAGARYGIDLQEVNPPLFVWLSEVPVLLSNATGFPAWPIAVALLTLLMGACLPMVVGLLRVLPRDTSRERQQLFLLLTAAAMSVLPRYDFAEREHLAFVLVIPYIVLAALRASNGHSSAATSMVAGLFAGFGFALKPFFLPGWILVELFLVARRGWRILLRTEEVVLVCTGFTYLLCVLLLQPDYVKLAVALRTVYAAYLHNPLRFVLAPTLWASLPLFASITYFAVRANVGREPFREVLMLAMAGFWIGAILQGKGLEYHYLPAIGFGFLLMADIAVHWPGVHGLRPSALVLQGTRALAFILPLACATQLTIDAMRHRTPPYVDAHLPLLLPYVQQEAAAHRPVAVLSSIPSSAWPLVSAGGAKWAYRYMSLWMLAGFYWDQVVDGKVVQFRPLSQRRGLERTFSDAVIEDLLRTQPGTLVVLNVDSTFMGAGGSTQLDYLAYFSADPRFRAFLGGYHIAGQVGRYSVYQRP